MAVDTMDVAPGVMQALGVANQQFEKLVIVLEVGDVVRVYWKGFAVLRDPDSLGKAFDVQNVADVQVADGCTVTVVPHEEK